ncbi:hypothetical protein GCM10027034_21660 [Ramlibacter solisilvae]|uniref:ATPase n=1 Tax=Ramlibacter tataouinensis TaxID=94132 RepID=A0A127JPU0_9BURK|nr:ATP-binding protein [Ramlibacter tataouinensis]AMO21913.1 ATPase [Ramlibacter tataouinensis]
MKIALLGAESTGKSTLAVELAAHFNGLGRRAVAVPEALPAWSERQQRAPRPEEQMAIAQEQERRVDEAVGTAEVVIADTTALMVAIYGAMLVEDGGLYGFALERLRTYEHCLLTGLDLPWTGDGLQRDGPQVREPVDALVRAALLTAQVPYRVVYGHGGERLRNALLAIGEPRETGRSERPWTWLCDKCSDPDCEHRLFSRLRS